MSNFIINPYNFAVADTNLLLDDYPATAAYSVRKISKDYTGDALWIRRSIDNMECKVAFDTNDIISLDSTVTNVTEETAGGGLNTGSTSANNLGEFVNASGYSNPDSLGSSSSAFVVKIFDQSGNNRDLTQTGASNQLQLLNAGAVYTINSKIAIKVQGNNYHMDMTSWSASSGYWNFLVHQFDAANGLLAYDPTKYYFTLQNGNAGTPEQTAGTPTYYKNGSELVSADRDDLYDNFAIGSQTLATIEDLDLSTWSTWAYNAYPNFGFTGYFQELVLYNSDQSSNKTNIESNMNTYFSVY